MALQETLNTLIGKNVIIKQTGFILSQNVLEKLTCCIKDDNLNLEDISKENYVSLNLNQVYKIEKSENQIKLYLDNDTQLEIKQ